MLLTHRVSAAAAKISRRGESAGGQGEIGVLIKRYRKTIMQSPEGPSEAQWDVS